MKKFVFTLQKLYDVKEIEEDQKRSELKELGKKLDSIMERLSQLHETYESQKEKYARDCKKGVSAFELQRYGDYFKFLNEEIVLHKHMKAECEAAIDVCRQEILRLINEKKVLDRMREEQYEAYMAELAKHTEREIEDFMQGRL